MSKIVDVNYYYYILEHNNYVKGFYYKINERNSFLNFKDFKNFINFLKTQKKLEWKLKKEWCISPSDKRILYIEFGGLYANFWKKGQCLEDYRNLFINN